MTEKCKALYRKYEEIIVYLIVGVLTTIVAWTAKFVANALLFRNTMYPTPFENTVLSTINWVAGVIFAYFTNRRFVFKSKNVSRGSLLKEFASFIGARIATEFLEVGFMYLAVDIFGMNSYIAKLIGQVLVIVSNYFLSKLWIFKKK